MTEREWLCRADPARMPDHLREAGPFSDRPQRLPDCACVRRAWHLLALVPAKHGRTDSPCPRCYAGGYCGPDGTPCKAAKAFDPRNRARAGLTRLLPMDNIADAGGQSCGRTGPR